MPPSDFGTRTLPSPTYPKVEGRTLRPLASAGGARGPVGYPGSVAKDVPAPPDARSPYGQSRWTWLERRFGIYPWWANGGNNPPTWFKLTFWNAVNWRRGHYDNDYATKNYHSPVPQPSWSANAPAFLSRATSPNFTFRKWIGTWSTKEDYHQDAQRYPLNYPVPWPVIPSATLYRMRSPQTPRIRGGRFDNLTRWGRAQATGSRTVTLPTAPAGQNDNSYGGVY